MSDSLSIQGTLAETTVPDLFRSLVRSGETGIVSLEAIGRGDSTTRTSNFVIVSRCTPTMRSVERIEQPSTRALRVANCFSRGRTFDIYIL